MFYIAHSLNDIVKFLLSPGMEYVLTELFNQDPLEMFFGQQSSRGGYCENPSTKTVFVQHAGNNGSNIIGSSWNQ